MQKLIATMLLFVAGAMPAAAVTIDFEEFNVGDGSNSNGLSSLQSNGFTIEGSNTLFGPGPGTSVLIGNNGTKSFGGSHTGLGQDGFGPIVSFQLESSDDGAFALYDFDFFTASSSPNAFSNVLGRTMSGADVTLNTALGTGGWLNLRSVLFIVEGDNFGFSTVTGQIDNIVVSTVPVPAAVWLFASGLGLLGWLRRRHVANQ